MLKLKVVSSCKARPIIYYDGKLSLYFPIYSSSTKEEDRLAARSKTMLNLYLFCGLNGLLYVQDDLMIICYNLCIYFEKLL